ncbi:MAG: glycosyltransferase, partial [Candidatus Sabulitectum sp.]|nr:glycosyltransferase [Candidatus Sabulitectum sp.]
GCDCMILASLKEGSPNVVKEALACNTPVVSVRVGDVCSLLDDTAGCYTCKHDAIDMGEKIKNVLAERIKIDGRKTLTAKGLDAGIVADRLLEIYRGSIKSDL